ncbi:hypothetical protein [Nocardioides convexus]|uniref:hypothetical protein n=1 Tax=Nocardioides convexus TaxID=2712224 RepID=UPI0024189C8B|nr:hypothetical protein [Nocardioides convexus]
MWMHGTPGARRQIPVDARRYAEEAGLRIIGIDRPGIGSSTPYLYPEVLDWTRDLEAPAGCPGRGGPAGDRAVGRRAVRAGGRRRAAGPGAGRGGAGRGRPDPRSGRRRGRHHPGSPCTPLRCSRRPGSRWGWR